MKTKIEWNYIVQVEGEREWTEKRGKQIVLKKKKCEEEKTKDRIIVKKK